MSDSTNPSSKILKPTRLFVGADRYGTYLFSSEPKGEYSGNTAEFLKGNAILKLHDDSFNLEYLTFVEVELKELPKGKITLRQIKDFLEKFTGKNFFPTDRKDFIYSDELNMNVCRNEDIPSGFAMSFRGSNFPVPKTLEELEILIKIIWGSINE